MEEIEKYKAVNSCETFQELANVIMSFANEDGMIQGRTREFHAEPMAARCQHFNMGNPNVLTREFGIRQQAMYIHYYNPSLGEIIVKPYNLGNKP